MATGSVYERAPGNWAAHVHFVDDEGRKRQRKKSGFKNRRQATQHLSKMLEEFDRGVRPPPASFTLSDWILEWLDERQALGAVKPSSIAASRNRHRLYIEGGLGSMKLTEVGTVHIDRVYRKLTEDGLAPATVRTVHALVHAALRDAVRKGLLGHNPASNCSLPRRKKREHTIWTAEQTREFIDGLAADDPLKPVVRFVAATGVRRGEAIGLTWDYVDLDAASVTIAQSLTPVDGRTTLTSTKNHQVRSLDIDPGTAAMLRGLRVQAASDALRSGGRLPAGLFVFLRNGKPWSPGILTEQYRLAVRRSELPVIRLHDLRHTNATLLVEAGVPLAQVSQRLGHSSYAFTADNYVSRVSQSQSSEAIGRLFG